MGAFVTRDQQFFFLNEKEVRGVQDAQISYSLPSIEYRYLGMNKPLTVPQGARGGKATFDYFLVSNDPFLPFATGESSFDGFLIKNKKNDLDHIGFTNAYVANYSLNCKVGEIPQASVDVDIFGNIGKLARYESTHLISGALISGAAYGSIQPINPNGISLTTSGFNSNRVESFAVNFAPLRKPNFILGQSAPKSVDLTYPIDANLSFTLSAADYETFTLNRFPGQRKEEDIKIDLNTKKQYINVQNYLAYSNSFSNDTYWSKVAGAVSEVGIENPIANTQSWKLEFTGSYTNAPHVRQFMGAVEDNIAVNVSFYVKYLNHPYIRFAWTTKNTTFTLVNIAYDLLKEKVINVSSYVSNLKVDKLKNDWFYVSFDTVSQAGSSTASLYLMLISEANGTFAGTNGIGCYFANFQVRKVGSDNVYLQTEATKALSTVPAAVTSVEPLITFDFKNIKFVGQSVNATSNGVGTVTLNYRASLVDKPEIVKDKLIAYYDFTNPRVFTSGSQSIYNLAPNYPQVTGVIRTGVNLFLQSGHFYFDGVDDFIHINNFTCGNAGTVSFWAKIQDYDQVIPFTYKGKDYTYGPELYLVGNNPYWNIGDGASSANRFGYTSAYPTGVWQYWTITSDPVKNNTTLYLDGVKRGETIYRNPESTNATLRLGCISSNESNPTNYYYKGWLEHVKLYDKVLSEAEIKQNYEATKVREFAWKGNLILWSEDFTKWTINTYVFPNVEMNPFGERTASIIKTKNVSSNQIVSYLTNIAYPYLTVRFWIKTTKLGYRHMFTLWYDGEARNMTQTARIIYGPGRLTWESTRYTIDDLSTDRWTLIEVSCDEYILGQSMSVRLYPDRFTPTKDQAFALWGVHCFASDWKRDYVKTEGAAKLVPSEW